MATGAAAAVAPLAAPPGLPGWCEAVVIVPDLAPWIETLTRVGGWEVLDRTHGETSLNRFWALPETARCDQVLMRNIGTRTGWLRLVRVEGAEQRQIRPDDQAWDVGGVQALDIRVLDIEATRQSLHARGWRAQSDPVRYKTYGVEVIQWAPVSPDGVRLSLIQRIAPPLVGWSELKHWSRVANAAITVDDMAASQAFFGGVLGLSAASHSNTAGGDGPNVMGMPWSFERRTPLEIVGYTGAGAAVGYSGVDGGAIELIALPEARGRNFAVDAHPPNFGVAALRIRVADAAAAANALAGRGAALAAPLQTLTIPPYGALPAFAVTAPDGVRLEIFSRVDFVP
jgi:catechol 2,3-dioxygenase-like lactoylglutathione lyase family enzyme